MRKLILLLISFSRGRRRLWPESAVLLLAVTGALIGRGWELRAQETPPLPVYFTDNIGRTAPAPSPTQLEAALLAAIAGAQSSLDVAIYDFNREAIRDALLAAAARGVAVRVVTDGEARAAEGFKPFFDALAAAGVPIVDDGGASAAAALSVAQVEALAAEGVFAPLTSGIVHNKYLIIDGTTVWTGSVNMSNTDIGLNHNNALLVQNAAVAAAYADDFGQMFAGNFGTKKLPSPQTSFTLTVAISQTAALTSPAAVETIGLQLYFAPQDLPLQRIVEEVEAARRSIDFAIFYFTSDSLRDALIAAHQRGVAVRGIWDSLGSANNYSDDEALCAAGISVRIEQTAGKMHNKLMVIDALGDNPRVVTGSLNWTESGSTINNENTLVVHSAGLTHLYGAHFQQLWEQVGGVPCNPEPALRQHAVLLPVVRNGPPDPNFATPTSTASPVPTVLATATAPPGVTPVPPGASPRIERVVYNPAGDDLANERVEMRNAGGAALDMAGWTLHDEAGATYTFPAVAIGPGALLTLWVRAGSDDAANLYWGRSSPVWNNNGDTATLRRADGSVASACAYAGGGEEVLCEEPLPGQAWPY